MSDFAPANADHAVVGVVFALELDAPLPQQWIGRLMKNEPSAMQGLPWIEELPAFSLAAPSVSQNGGAISIGGVQFGYLRPNGQALWMLRLQADEIRIECYQYTRWKNVWETAERYFSQAMDCIRAEAPDIKVQRLTMTVEDKFAGAQSGYDAATLLRRESMLGQVPFSKGDLWHVYLGWFDAELWGKVLNNLNVQAQATLGEEPLVHTITISHYLEARLGEPTAYDAKELADRMESLHQRNKAVLVTLLTDEQLDKIGLKS